jgi:hypothetical protein
MGAVTLEEALDLVRLVAEVAPDRLDRLCAVVAARLADERMLGSPDWLTETRRRFGPLAGGV